MDLAIRVLVGSLFLFYGVNSILKWVPIPDPEKPMQEFLRAAEKTVFLLPLAKGVEILAGLLLLSGYFVPLALVMLAPVVVGIVGLQFFLNRKNCFPVIAQVIVPYFFLIWVQWGSLAFLFQPF